MANKKITRQEFIDKANAIHNFKYDYSLVEEGTPTRSIISIICKEHGVFTQRMSAHLGSQGCRKCRNDSVGDRFRFNKEQFVEIANKIHNFKYNYDEFIYVTDKIDGLIKCPVHGKSFIQSPSNHKKGKGCPTCSKESFVKNKRNSLEQILKLADEKHGKGAFDYSEIEENVHSHDIVLLKCNTCNNKFKRILYSHINIGNACPACQISKQEVLLRNFIKDDLSLEVESSNRKILEGCEIDLLVSSHNFGIEVNGNYWHSELVAKKDKNYHLQKTEKAADNGVFLVQFFEDEILYKYDICKSIIKTKLGKSQNRIFARKCTIKEISVIQTKNEFLEENHIQGKDQSKIKLGLYYGDVLVSLMTFGVPRYNKNVEWELIRFCNKLDHSIVGGASKLFAHFVETYQPKSIISYADRRISQGNVYEVLKFRHAHNSLPRYFYMNKKNYLKRYHRSNFTKDKIKRLYPEVDISKDEWSIMQELGYDRIWDCGNKVYIWNP
jgi:hypothetical protein